MKKGFTLIELIVVIAIIAILAAIIAPNAFKAIEKAKVTQLIANIKSIKTAVAGYYADTGKWPLIYDPISYPNSSNPFFLDPADPGWNHPQNALPYTDPTVSGWDGPYLTKWNTHPWGGGIAWLYPSAWDMDPANPGTSDLIYDDGEFLAAPHKVGTNWHSGGAPVPDGALRKIDETLDDGNLATGNVREYGAEFNLKSGTLGYIILHNGTL